MIFKIIDPLVVILATTQVSAFELLPGLSFETKFKIKSEIRSCVHSIDGLDSKKVKQLEKQEEVRLQDIFQDYEHLFPVLMPQDAIANNYEETKKSFVVHFNDSFKKFPNLDQFREANINKKYKSANAPVQVITGSMKYVGIFSAKYAYDLEFKANTYYHKVRIHFKNPKKEDLKNFEAKIKEAEAIWNQSLANELFKSDFGLDFNYAFQFDIELDVKKSHFSVGIADKTRGPYYLEWSRNWTSLVVAHEIGHMMGLGDEYKTLTGEDDCLDQSLMCKSWSAELMYHHYYHILKRLF